MRYAVIVLLALSTGLFITLKSDPPESPERQNITVRTPRDRPAGSPHANDPPAPPLRPIHPEDMGIKVPAETVDHPARITRAIAQSDLPAIQTAVSSWFDQDPEATRDWLSTQETYEDLQPAISYIVSGIAEKGDLKTAVKWSALISDGTLRDDTLFQIHALALRNGIITPSEIPLELIPDVRQQELLSGAAGD
jgi:hypothetical protein